MAKIQIREKDLFSKALNGLLDERKAIPDEAHPALDVGFLAAFLANALTEEQLEAYRQHLAKCDLCQEAMALQAKAGNLEYTAPKKSPQNASRKRQKQNWAVYVAVACALLLLIGWLGISSLVSSAKKDPKTQIAQVDDGKKTDTNTDANPAAPTNATPAISIETPPENVTKQEAEDSSTLKSPETEKPARKALLAMLTPGDVPQTLSLNQLGIWPNGLLVTKSLATASPEDLKKAEAFQLAMKEAPEDFDLTLDYVAFLLFKADDAELAEPLVKDLAEKPLSDAQKLRLAQLRGTLAFQLGDCLQAIEAFQSVANQTREPLDRLNLATALYANEQRDEACALLESLKDQIQDEKIQKQIDTVLKFSKQGDSNED